MNPMNLDRLWESVLAEIELQVSRPNFITWFSNSRLIEKNEGVALVALPNNFVKKWVENHHQRVVLGALRNLDEGTKQVQFVVASNGVTQQKQAPRNKSLESPIESGQLAFSEFKIDPETNLNPRYTLNSFVVGKSNELAFAAIQALAEEPGHRYNPFFIYGGVGLGKTHLIQGVGNEIKKRYHNQARVRYVSSEKFTNDVIWAIKNKRTETLKERYRLIDVLIIDDIQFIAGKPATEEEFFHTFNALYENNKQIIISSDRPPKFIPTLEERLRSRFEGGMIADIGYPDYELRYAIIKTKLDERGASLTDEVIEVVANKVQQSIREVEGVLHKLLFYQAQQPDKLTKRFAEQVIADATQKPTKNITSNHIIRAVADFYEVSPADLINRSRKKEIAESRQVAMFLMRDMLSLSYPHIGRKLGKRDHTTAIYACEKISQEINRNQNIHHKVMAIKDVINELGE